MNVWSREGIVMSGYCFVAGLKVYFGEDSVQHTSQAVKELGCKNPLIVADREVVKTGNLELLFNSLQKEKIAWQMTQGVEENSPTSCVDAVAEAARLYKSDGIIAVGGGSTIDTAKTAALLAKQGGGIEEYFPETGKVFGAERLPLLSVPTTSGTGSELSIYAVHTNSITGEKFCYTGAKFTSTMVILDPKLPSTMPERYTVSTAADALIHAIEAYTSKTFLCTPFPYIQALSIETIRLVKEYLPVVLKQPNNLHARLKLMFAASMGGAVIGYGVGAAHGMDSVLIHHYGMAHGEAVGQLIPGVMKYNYAACREQMRNIASAMGLELEGENDKEDIKVWEKVRRFLRQCGLTPLKKFVDSAEDFQNLAYEMKDSYSVVENIVPMGADDIEKILLESLQEID